MHALTCSVSEGDRDRVAIVAVHHDGAFNLTQNGSLVGYKLKSNQIELKVHFIVIGNTREEIVEVEVDVLPRDRCL